MNEATGMDSGKQPQLAEGSAPDHLRRTRWARSTWGRAVTAMLGMILLVGITPSTVRPQDPGEGEPPSHGPKAAYCNFVGCPDTTALHCSTGELTVTAEMALELLKVFGVKVEVGASISVTCYQGVIPTT